MNLKNLIKNILPLIILGLVFIKTVYALEIDEKLTMRIVNISKSGKTVLINRGIEDGLVQGDHAKFFITVGVIARGVVVKVSPTRSVWSLYRIVNADYIRPDSVLNIKITSPVKITNDDSKTIIKDDTPSLVGITDPRKLGIPLSEGADDLGNIQLSGGINEAELKALAGANITNIRDRNMEVWVGFNFSSKTVSSDPGDGSTVYSSTELNLDLSAGYEYYFKNEKLWYGRFSFVVFFQMNNDYKMSHDGEQVTISRKEFGGGINWHPFTLPSAVNQFIPFFTTNAFYGAITDGYISGISNSNDSSVSGAAMGFTVGVGLKFYTGEGYGVRGVADYYTRTDTFEKNTDYALEYIKSNSGPRVYVALSYRF
jgi:hypothetical protein